MSEAAMGPPETAAERLARAPRVLLSYARDIDKYGKPLDSGLPALLRFIADQLPEIARLTERCDAYSANVIKYGEHLSDCPRRRDFTRPCGCGFSAAIDQAMFPEAALASPAQEQKDKTT